MMTYIKIFFTSVVLLGFFDFIWLGFIVKNFNNQQLQNIGRLQNGEISPWPLPALIVYLLMAIALTAFASPRIFDSTLVNCFMWGALLGLCIYGVFDLTNLSILKNYPVIFALVDITWGTVLFGTTNMILFLLKDRIF